MITIFNRAELFTDVNQEAAARVWSTLKANGIEYEMNVDILTGRIFDTDKDHFDRYDRHDHDWDDLFDFDRD